MLISKNYAITLAISKKWKIWRLMMDRKAVPKLLPTTAAYRIWIYRSES